MSTTHVPKDSPHHIVRVATGSGFDGSERGVSVKRRVSQTRDRRPEGRSGAREPPDCARHPTDWSSCVVPTRCNRGIERPREAFALDRELDVEITSTWACSPCEPGSVRAQRVGAADVVVCLLSHGRLATRGCDEFGSVRVVVTVALQTLGDRVDLRGGARERRIASGDPVDTAALYDELIASVHLATSSGDGVVRVCNSADRTARMLAQLLSGSEHAVFADERLISCSVGAWRWLGWLPCRRPVS